MPTARVYAGAAFGFVSSSDADYDAAKDGAGTLALDTTHDLRVGQSKPSGFLVEQGFLSVTPPVPLAVSARVTAATLYVYIETDASTTDFTVNARELSYGTLQMNDFVASTDLAGDTLLASKSTAGIAAGYLALTSEVALITRLPWLDGIYLSSSRQGTEPAGNEYVVIGKPGGAHPRTSSSLTKTTPSTRSSAATCTSTSARPPPSTTPRRGGSTSAPPCPAATARRGS